MESFAQGLGNGTPGRADGDLGSLSVAGIATVDDSRNVVGWSDTAERLTGIPCAEAIGAAWKEIAARLWPAATADERYFAEDCGVPDVVIELEAGGERRLDIAVADGGSNDSEPGATTLIITDVTRYQRVEEDLERRIEALESHIDERAEIMVRANRALEQEIIERTRAQDRLRVQYERTLALRALDSAFTGTYDVPFTLGLLVNQALGHLEADAVAVLLADESKQTLRFAAGHGFPNPAIESIPVPIGFDPAGICALDCSIEIISDFSTSEIRSKRMRMLRDSGFVAYLSAPLLAKGKIMGVIEVLHRTPYEVSLDVLEFIEALVSQTAMALDNTMLFESLQQSNKELSQAYDATIEGWSRALDLRDEATEGHSKRVTEMTALLARALYLPEEEIVHIQRGALLHDIGKMGIPDSVLLKPDKLTLEEFDIIKRHPEYAYKMLSPIDFLRPALDIPFCHHEKWDGTGYPRALKGAQIPLAARIFSVVDVWDAMKSTRPYREGWSDERVCAHIRSLSGTQFDPDVVEAALPVLFPNLYALDAAA